MCKRETGSNFGLSYERQQKRTDSMDQSSLHRLQIIWDFDSDTENFSVRKQTGARSDHEQTVGGTSSSTD